MVDTVSKSVRSRVMRAVKSRGTRPEGLLRLALVRGALRGWRIQADTLPGKPDFIFELEKLAIFVDGCFWHGCKSCYRRPKSNKSYWVVKLRSNMARDKASVRALKAQGWRTLRLWEHQVRRNVDVCVELVRKRLT